MNMDTIYAPATALGGAIAVIRVSGDASRRIAETIAGAAPVATPNRLCHCALRDGDSLLDEGMAVFFAHPHSYTGEDMLELHCHGGVRTVQTVLSCLSRYARPAEGGEFTKRAFLNGKMDLSRAEAVMDLVNATAEQSRRAALYQLRGGIARAVAAIEECLLDANAAIEAGIDFPDEAEDDAVRQLPASLSFALSEIETLLQRGRVGRILRDGLRVAIVGKPNVGKSSLLNRLLGEERAIVTATAGTTRDVLCESIQLMGVPVKLFDTAGLRDAADEAERIGVDRAREALAHADAVLAVFDASLPLDEQDHQTLTLAAARPYLAVGNKRDLGVAADIPGAVPVSAKTGEGMDELVRRLLALVMDDPADCTCVTNERHLAALSDARSALESAQAAAELELVATDIRQALHALGTITGREVDAAVIDRIFANFCVGK